MPSLILLLAAALVACGGGDATTTQKAGASGASGQGSGGQGGSGQAGSGQAGSGQAGSGQAGSGQAGSGQAGSGEAGQGGGAAAGAGGEAAGGPGGEGGGEQGGAGAGGEASAGAGGEGPAGAGGADACGAGGPKGDSTQTISVGGAQRSYNMHLPPGYQPGTPAPLVLMFHGLTQTPEALAYVSKMNAEADARGFLLAYGAGLGNSWNAGACCGTSAPANVDDVAFAKAMLDHVQKLYCVDPRRVFASGLSNGGMMSHRLGCEMADRIAAIAPVAGTITVKDCSPSRPVPAIMFHGTSDFVVPYGTDGFQGSKNAPGTFDDWSKRDGCTDEPKQVYSQGDASCVERSACNAGAAVRFCTIDGGGHQWPGGNDIFLGKLSKDINASAEILEFFKAHPMP